MSNWTGVVAVLCTAVGTGLAVWSAVRARRAEDRSAKREDLTAARAELELALETQGGLIGNLRTELDRERADKASLAQEVGALRAAVAACDEDKGLLRLTVEQLERRVRELEGPPG